MELLRYLFSFHGRINRAPLWIFIITIVILGALFDVLAPLAERVLGTVTVWIFSFGFSLAVSISATSFQARRFHDRDMSAWWVLAGWVPAILLNCALWIVVLFASPEVLESSVNYLPWLGIPLFALWLWLVVQLLFLRGTVGSNRYGSDPLAETRPDFALQSSRD